MSVKRKDSFQSLLLKNHSYVNIQRNHLLRRRRRSRGRGAVSAFGAQGVSVTLLESHHDFRINYAIQDAVVTANLLHKPLLEKTVDESDLAKVQKRREFPTKVIQSFQNFVPERVIRTALNPKIKFQPPWIFRLPLLRRIPPRLLAFGVGRVRVE